MGTEKTFLPEPHFSQLNAAHFQLLLAESKIALAERAFTDARRDHQFILQKRNAVVKAVGEAVGCTIKTWDTVSGEVEYEPVPEPVKDTKPADPEPLSLVDAVEQFKLRVRNTYQVVSEPEALWQGNLFGEPTAALVEARVVRKPGENNDHKKPAPFARR